MSAEPPLLTAERLRTAFGRLDKHLTDAFVTADVFVFGGAVMALGYEARPGTRDVDVLWRPHGAVLKAAWSVAEEMGLLRSWLNDQASVNLPGGLPWTGDVLFAGRSLRVIAAEPELLLAMKVRAGRLIDVQDVHTLSAHLGLSEAKEILAIAERVLGEPVPLRQRQIIEDEFPETANT
jgi:hypothetical protein